jgi:hypothetical protein
MSCVFLKTFRHSKRLDGMSSTLALAKPPDDNWRHMRKEPFTSFGAGTTSGAPGIALAETGVDGDGGVINFRRSLERVSSEGPL